MSKRLPTAVIAPILAAAIAVPADAAELTAYATPEETKAEFEAVCKRVVESENVYLGRAIVARIQGLLEVPAEDPLTDVYWRGRLADELLRLGRTEEAKAEIERARAALAAPPPGDPQFEQKRTVLARALHWSLAMAHFRRAEEENCVGLHASASCILPIDPAAIHERRESGRKAGDLFLSYLETSPDAVQARWLLNLSRMVTGDFPDGVPEPHRVPPQAFSPKSDFPRWRDVSNLVGIETFDLAGGSILDDFDGDGLLDIVTSSWEPCTPMKGFRNDGRGGFTDVSKEWGLDAQLGGLNLLHADYDNDGRLDILVLRGAWLGDMGQIRNSLLRNDLDRPAGRFVDVSAAAGVAYPAYPTQAAGWGDFDGDGFLDLYVGNESPISQADPLQLIGRTGNPYPSQLYRNRGDGTFVDVARAAGVTNLRFAKSVAWGDYDDDGDPDLYVSNFGPNRLYRNNGDGTFTDVAAEAGVTEPEAASFPSWFFDFDNDGDLDIFVADYGTYFPEISASYLGFTTAGGHPLLYRNDGGGRFTEVSISAGLWRPQLPMGANYGDLDNDGYQDFYLGTGVPNLEAVMPNAMFRNVGGRRFLDVTFDGGFGHLQKGHGISFADLDNDGDQDLFAQMGGAFPADGFYNALYENPGFGHRWIVLRLEGRRANRFAVGGRIGVRVRDAEGSRSVHVQVGSGGSFGASSLQAEIGLGAAAAIESIEIRWPGSGLRQTFAGVPLDGFYRAVEGEPALERLEPPRIALGKGRTVPAHDHQRHGGSGR